MRKNSVLFIIILIVIILIVVGLISTFAQGSQVKLSGDIKNINYDVEDFNSISVAGQGNVFIEQDDSEDLDIEVDSNLEQFISVSVIDDELRIKYEPRLIFWSFSIINADINYFIKVKDLEQIKLAGSTVMETSEIESDELELNLSGSNKSNIDVDTDDLKIKISGSAEVEATGVTENVDINISGSGEFNGLELEADDADAEIAGSGKINLFAQDTLEAKISGSGKIRYKGEPQIKSSRISGSGSIEAIE